MAAYRLAMTCGLSACTPGSAPGPTLVNEYGILYILRKENVAAQRAHAADEWIRRREG